MKVLITGATGFVGGHLVKKCRQKGWQISAFVLPGDAGAVALEAQGVKVLYGDIRNESDVDAAVNGHQLIFHAAAFVSDWGPAQMFYEVTVKGTENICKAAVKHSVKRLVKISTNDVFGIQEDVVLDETFPMRPWNEPYADTKIQAEEVAWHYFKNHQLPVTMVYPCWIYGPGDKTFVPLLADAILKNEMVFMRKHALVWPAYVENVVDLMLTIAEHPAAPGNGYLVHDGEFTTLEAFCSQVASVYNKEMKFRYIPFKLALFVAFLMEFFWKLFRIKQRPLLTTYTVKNLGSKLRFSIAKAKAEVQWQPAVSFNEGMKITLEWLKTMNIDQLKQK